MTTEKTPLEVLQEAFPDRSPKELANAVVEQAYAKAALPEWSMLEHGQVQVQKQADLGASIWCYFRDPLRIDRANGTIGEPLVLLAKRGKNRDAQGNPQYGALGGYMELGALHEAGEQPEEGAVREAREETADDRGDAVLAIDSKRLRAMVSGVDWRHPAHPVQYTGHACELTKQEFQAVTEHAQRIATDPDYAAAVLEKTKGEIVGFEIMPLSKALQLTETQFAHPHELKALENLEALIAQDRKLGR